MSSKLSVCAYTAIIDFNLFYLTLLETSISSKYTLETSVNQSTLLITENTTYILITSEITTDVEITTATSVSSDLPPNFITSLSDTTLVNTQQLDSKRMLFITTSTSLLSTLAATAAILGGEVGSPCTNYTDCLGGEVVGLLDIYQTMACVNNVCECNSPYTRVVYKPKYQCAIPNGNQVCQEDIQCVGVCSESGNQKKCTG